MEQLHIYSVEDALNMPDTALRYAIDNLAHRDGLTLITGGPGAGKTWLALAAGMAVAAGQPFCGLDTTPGTVLYVDLESGARRISRRLKKLAAAGLTPSAESQLVIVDGVGAGVTDWPAALSTLCEKYKPVMVIIDPVVRLMGDKDENSATAVRSVFAPLAGLAQDFGMSVILVHHPRKRMPGERGISSRGSGDFSAVVNREIHLIDKGDCVELDIVKNNDEEPGALQGLTYKMVDNANHTALTIDCISKTFSSDEGVRTPRKSKSEKAERALLAILADGPAAASDARDLLKKRHNIGRNSANAAFSALVEAGACDDSDYGIWKLADTPKLEVA